MSIGGKTTKLPIRKLATLLATIFPDWSNQKLAEVLGVNPSTLSRYPELTSIRRLRHKSPRRRRFVENLDGTAPDQGADAPPEEIH